MTLKQLHKKLNPQEFKIGSEPFVALSLEKWYELEDMLLMNDPKIQKELAEAKKEIEEGKGIPYRELRKDLGLK